MPRHSRLNLKNKITPVLRLLRLLRLGAKSVSRARLAKFCQTIQACIMSTMNIFLPESLKDFVDDQVAQDGYGTSSDYVRELIRRDSDRLRLRGLLLEGAASAAAAPADSTYFNGLRKRVQQRAQGSNPGR